jgi:predicted secreted protein
MKAKLFILSLVVVVALALAACSPVPPPQNLNIEGAQEEFMEQEHITGQVEIAEGGLLKITLESNPSTGFMWGEPEVSNEAVLKQVGESEYIEPGQEAVGSAGKQIWTFEALHVGVATIALEYSQPWEDGIKAGWSYNVTVTVK